MYIVKIGRGAHSAWNTLKEAVKQLNVCEDAGMTNFSDKWGEVEQDDIVTTENGHYFY